MRTSIMYGQQQCGSFPDKKIFLLMDPYHCMYSALALVMSKIKVGTTVKPNGSRPQFFIKTWSYMSGELRECSNFKNFFVKNCKNLGFLGQSGL